MLGDCGGCRLVETRETRMVNQGGIVLVMEVREAGIWLERGGVLWRRAWREKVRAGIKARTRIGAWV